MYREFAIKVKDATLMGYFWAAENPRKIVVIVHGVGEHCGRYNRMATQLIENDFAVIGVDLRGHGCSTGKRGHAAPRSAILKDIDAILLYAHNLYEELPIILYGHSMGGNLVLDYRNRGTYSDKVDAYAVCSPWLMLKKRIPKLVAGAVEIMSKINPEKQISAGIIPAYLGNPEILSQGLNHELTHNIITLGTAVDNYKIGKAILEGKAEKNEINGLDKPLLLMHGSGDKICSVLGSRTLAKQLSQKDRYVEWEGYFHELHNGNDENDGSEPINALIEWILC